MQNITVTMATNITYDGFTYNTPLIVEYKHTGKQYHCKNKFTDSKEIADEWISKGKKVIVKDGYFFIDRMAIPNTLANGKKDIWYINNDNDTYSINKVSKYGKKIHSLLSNNINPFN